jgi:DNA polymerase-3 subunit delta'
VQRGQDQHELPIKSIRDLCAEMALRPMRGSRRIAIVSDADSLSEEASNAFLKTLEEPPSRSLIILLARSADLLLPTIRSRCQVMSFRELGPADMAEQLVEEKLAADRTEADVLVARAGGNLTRARLLADPEFQEVWQGILKELCNPEGFEPGALAKTVESHARQGSDTALHRERTRAILTELAEWWGTILRVGAGIDADSGDPDRFQAAQLMARRLEPETVFQLIERTLDSLVQLDRRAHLGLLLEALFHDCRVQLG